jgi:hypothetical protein
MTRASFELESMGAVGFELKTHNWGQIIARAAFKITPSLKAIDSPSIFVQFSLIMLNKIPSNK